MKEEFNKLLHIGLSVLIVLALFVSLTSNSNADSVMLRSKTGTIVLAFNVVITKNISSEITIRSAQTLNEIHLLKDDSEVTIITKDIDSSKPSSTVLIQPF